MTAIALKESVKILGAYLDPRNGTLCRPPRSLRIRFLFIRPLLGAGKKEPLDTAWSGDLNPVSQVVEPHS